MMYVCTGCGLHQTNSNFIRYNGGVFHSQACLDSFLKKTSGGSSSDSGGSSVSYEKTAAQLEAEGIAESEAAAARAQQAAAEAQRSAI